LPKLDLRYQNIYHIFSLSDHLKYRLDLYVSFLPKVRIVRYKKAVGRMAAVQGVIDGVKSKYFAIFDSHCEVNEGNMDWLVGWFYGV